MLFAYFFFIILGLGFNSSINAGEVYRQELALFKKQSAYQTIFDEKASLILRSMQRNIENYDQLSWFQDFVYCGWSSIVINSQNMPNLYGYIKQLCDEQDLAMPLVLLNNNPHFFNAMASKIFTSSGAITIGVALLEEFDDEVIQAILAHELGHIKYNHINKKLALLGISFLAATQLTDKKILEGFIFRKSLAGLMTDFMIGKSFEKQADEFACKEAGKGLGLIKFFECFKSRAAYRDFTYDQTKALIHAKRAQGKLGWYGYHKFNFLYKLQKFGHLTNKALTYVYHNTRFGTHPSPQDRIDAVKKYLEAGQV